MDGGTSKPSSSGGGHQSAQQKREDMRLTRMMLSIFLCFLVSFLPLMLVNVADDEMRVPTLHVIASVLAWGSAIVNPFIYAFKNRQYQQAFARVSTLANCHSHTFIDLYLEVVLNVVLGNSRA